MFAKLKEKIQKEGGNVTDVDKNLSPLPAVSLRSPRKVSLTDESPVPSQEKKDVQDESFSHSSSYDDLSKSDFSSKEEVLAALKKRTDQCRKLQTRISDYENVIKDNARKIEKLENFIEKQQDNLAKRTQELNEQYQASRVKILDGYKQELEQKEKENLQLKEKVKELESVREKYFKNEEEKEEMQEFTTQEMAKLRHMVILKEEEMSRCQKEIQDQREELEKLRVRNTELSEVENHVRTLEQDKIKLEEEVSDHSKIVSSLTKERMTVEETLNKVRAQLVEKSSMLSTLEAQHTDLESDHQILVRNSDIQKHKLEQQIQLQKDQLEQLEDRVKVLQQREQDQTLTGDERLIAVEKERDGLERKLAETREQLTQIKTLWSEKISHLEDQISHLNGKIAEDSEELAEAKNYTETVKEDLKKQIDGLKEKLKASEKQAKENHELVCKTEDKFKKERIELEAAVSKVKLEKVDLETHLRAKLTSVESELMSLEITRSQEKNQLQEQINELEKKVSGYAEKLNRSEQEVKTLEDKIHRLETELEDAGATSKALKEELNAKEKLLTESKALAQTLQEEVVLTQEKLEEAVKSSKSKSSQLQDSNKEKDELMLRNAELSQKLTALQQILQDDKQAVQLELKAKTESESELMQKCQALEAKIEEMSSFQSDHLVSNQEVTQLQETVNSLEEQLAEKNKALKKQEQRLNDLKKTLQRELKVQTLPNDEPVDPKLAALTPPLPRKNSLHREHQSRTHRSNSYERNRVPDESTIDTVDGINNSYGVQDYFIGDHSDNVPQGPKSNSERISPFSVPNHATISVNDTHGAHIHHSAYMSAGHSRGHSAPQRTNLGRQFDTQHLEKDINFQYLKHVVMKFMLSREHEAIQLIKAVSLLLRFTPDEQKLIRDTLEWKMSWFGGSQPPAVLRGQMSKIIPPSW